MTPKWSDSYFQSRLERNETKGEVRGIVRIPEELQRNGKQQLAEKESWRIAWGFSNPLILLSLLNVLCLESQFSLYLLI